MRKRKVDAEKGEVITNLFLDPDSPETQADSERGRAVFKTALRLVAAEPGERVTVGSLTFTACYRDGLFFREGVKPREFVHLGEALVLGFKKEKK